MNQAYLWIFVDTVNRIQSGDWTHDYPDDEVMWGTEDEIRKRIEGFSRFEDWRKFVLS